MNVNVDKAECTLLGIASAQGPDELTMFNNKSRQACDGKIARRSIYDHYCLMRHSMSCKCVRYKVKHDRAAPVYPTLRVVTKAPRLMAWPLG